MAKVQLINYGIGKEYLKTWKLQEGLELGVFFAPEYKALTASYKHGKVTFSYYY